MSKNNYRFFTEEEDKIIIDNYVKFGLAKVCELIPDRSQVSIQQRAKRLGVVVTRSKDGGTSSKAVKQPIPPLKKRTPKPKEWSKEEDYQIRKHDMNISEELIEVLPGRSVAAIEKRIQQLTNRKYVSSEQYTYVSYPLNVYVDVYGTYLGYDKSHSNFEEMIDRSMHNIIRANPSKPKLAKAMTRAFNMRYRDHLPSYDISRELGLQHEESVDKLCAQVLTILKRTMIKK